MSSPSSTQRISASISDPASMSDPTFALSIDESRKRIQSLLSECQKLLFSDAGRLIRLAREAHEIARTIGDRSLMGRSLYWIGVGFRQSSDLVSAGTFLRQANTLLFASGDSEYHARALQSIGSIHSASGELPEAIECFEHALKIARPTNDHYVITRVLNSWGIVAIRMADYAKAFELYDECLSYLRAHPDPYMEASILSNLGGIYQRMGDYASAVDACRRSLAVEGRNDDHRQDANATLMLADTLALLGRWAEAKDAIANVIGIAKEKDFIDIEALAYKSLVEIAKHAGHSMTDRASVSAHSSVDAIGLLEEARVLTEATGNTIYLQKIEVELALAHCRRGEVEQARSLLAVAMQRAETIGSPQILAETQLAMATCERYAMNVDAAIRALRAAMEQNDVLHSDSNKIAVRRLERRITPENSRRVQTSATLLESIAEEQALLAQAIVQQVQDLITNIKERSAEERQRTPAGSLLDGHDSATALTVIESAEAASHLLRQLDRVNDLDA